MIEFHTVYAVIVIGNGQTCEHRDDRVEIWPGQERDLPRVYRGVSEATTTIAEERAVGDEESTGVGASKGLNAIPRM